VYLLSAGFLLWRLENGIDFTISFAEIFRAFFCGAGRHDIADPLADQIYTHAVRFMENGIEVIGQFFLGASGHRHGSGKYFFYDSGGKFTDDILLAYKIVVECAFCHTGIFRNFFDGNVVKSPFADEFSGGSGQLGFCPLGFFWLKALRILLYYLYYISIK